MPSPPPALLLILHATEISFFLSTGSNLITFVPEDVEILSDLESTIATLAPPKEEEEPVIEELEDGEELPEGEEADDGETTSDQEQPTGDKDDSKEGDNKESSDGGSG